MKKPFVLLTILDGFGINKFGDPYEDGNAIELAKPGFFNSLKRNYPSTELEASGEAVGIPQGQIGSSEVGHLNIGAGRIVEQEIIHINKEMKNGNFAKNKNLLELINYCNTKNKPLHVMGLLSRGGVHSSFHHIEEILKIANDNKVKKLYLHAITDGRDTNPKSAKNFLKKIEQYMFDNKEWSIATLIGRFYAMDRDLRLERTKKAYNLYTKGEGTKAKDWKSALEREYRLGKTDEFVDPILLDKNGLIKSKDGFFFFNFRADRAREIIKAFRGELESFKTLNLEMLTMLPYYSEYKGKNVYDIEIVKNTLGELFADNGFKQLRLSETEKKAHVTYFFSGEREKPFKNEERKIFNSPKVKTYDLAPEMKSREITDFAIKAIKSKKYNFILINYPNTDMVGHTGNLDATMKAVKAVDACLKRISENIDLKEWIWVVTADHGNADMMLEHGKIHTAHTLNPVPFTILTDTKIVLKNGKLGNIAPTIIDLINRKGIKLEKPKEMIDSLINL